MAAGLRGRQLRGGYTRAGPREERVTGVQPAGGHSGSRSRSLGREEALVGSDDGEGRRGRGGASGFSARVAALVAVLAAAAGIALALLLIRVA
jgi:hypothetical protein